MPIKFSLKNKKLIATCYSLQVAEYYHLRKQSISSMSDAESRVLERNDQLFTT